MLNLLTTNIAGYASKRSNKEHTARKTDNSAAKNASIHMNKLSIMT
jgi:hypothetical protein